jgi:hypothetical protein
VNEGKRQDIDLDSERERKTRTRLKKKKLVNGLISSTNGQKEEDKKKNSLVVSILRQLIQK